MGRGRDSGIAPTEDVSVFVNQRQMRVRHLAGGNSDSRLLLIPVILGWTLHYY